MEKCSEYTMSLKNRKFVDAHKKGNALNRLRVDSQHRCFFAFLFLQKQEAAAEGNLSLKAGGDAIGMTC